MKSAAWMIMLAVLLQAPGTATATAGDKDDDACDKVKSQIRKIEAKMRNGYSAAQGIRYEDKLRELKEKRYRLCR